MPGLGSLLIRARIVYPVDALPIDNGFVSINAGRVAAIGPANRADGNPIDLIDAALFPGFVNAHTHLEFSQLNRPLGDPKLGFVDWIRAAISERRRRSFRPAAAIAAGYRESLRAGVTTIGEIATANASAYASDTCGPQLTIFREVIGFSRARADSAYMATCDDLADFESVVAQRPDAQLGVSPHSPYTVSPQLLARLIDLACERKIPSAMHLAESREEITFLRDGTGPFRELLEERSMWDPQVVPIGSRPLDYFQQLARAPRALVIHGNYLDGDEIEFLAAHRERLSLVHCPRTHAYFGHEPLDLGDMQARGVRLVLGTDSRASNPDLSLLAELRWVAMRNPQVSATDVLRMGTIDAAEALGRRESVGSLAVGKLANVVAMPLPADATGNAEKLLSAIFAADEQPSHVWLGGEPVEIESSH